MGRFTGQNFNKSSVFGLKPKWGFDPYGNLDSYQNHHKLGLCFSMV